MSARDETPSEQNEALSDLSESRVTGKEAEEVRGGATAAGAKPVEPPRKAIEISDYSFGIENP